MKSKKQDYYQKIFSWCEDQLQKSGHTPLFIGLSAPQGAGKTTLTNNILKYFQDKGLECVGLSLDDFYLTHEEQDKLASKYPDNPYLQKRGYPGTHDLELGLSVLTKLKQGQDLLIPRYNKAAHNGLGDREPKESWGKVSGPVDLVLLEGWMLGFKPTKVKEALEQINQNLEAYEPLLSFLDSFIYLQAKDYHYLIDWRIEAERKMAKEGKGAMSDQEIEAYVKTFLPAFEAYQNTILERKWGALLHLILGKDRLPL